MIQKDDYYLRKLVKNENREINIYKKYINMLSGGKTKGELHGFLNEHIGDKIRIQEIMRKKGIIKEEPYYLTDKISNVFTRVKTEFMDNPKDVVRDLYKNEIKSAIFTQKYFLEVSEDLRPDIEILIKGKRERIEKIHNLLQYL